MTEQSSSQKTPYGRAVSDLVEASRFSGRRFHTMTETGIVSDIDGIIARNKARTEAFDAIAEAIEQMRLSIAAEALGGAEFPDGEFTEFKTIQ